MTTPSQCKIAGIILAAGQSRRMAEVNKLLGRIDGTSLIKTIVTRTLEADLDNIIVVTGHDHARIEAELSGLKVDFINNSDFENGISTSLKAGIEALTPEIDAAVILLGDMPFITTDIIKAVVTSYKCLTKHTIIIPYHQGHRGNPVLWPREYFQELACLGGDQGARQLFKTYAQFIARVELGEQVLIDIDTPEKAAAFGLQGEGTNDT